MRPQLTSDMITALAAPVKYPIFFVSMQFNSSTEYFCTGFSSTGTINPTGIGWASAPSTSWVCLPGLISISLPEDGYDVKARGMNIEFAGLDPVITPKVQSQFTLGLPISIWFGLYQTPPTLTTSGWIWDSPYLLGTWRQDQPTFTIGTSELILNIAAETRIVDLNVPKNMLYTNEEQIAQLGYSNDIGFQFVDALQNKNLAVGGYIGRGMT